MNNYTVYHLHTDYSLLDSTTRYTDYIDRAKELGMSAIGFTEHGNIYNWIKKKQYCEKNDIKYMHGVEVYLTEKLEPKIRDNYHTILYAKNYEGVKEINTLVSLSNQKDHFYYKPRITFDEFLNTSNNIISTSACLASPLNKLDENSEYYSRLCEKYDYFEIQPHYNNQDQKDYNEYLYGLSFQYDKPLIMGTDTHEINKYKEECRKLLKKAKNMGYDNEDEFDLSFKTYEGLIKMCNTQDCFDMDTYKDAIENTNILADSIEDFKLDYSFKYPKLYKDEESMYIDEINKWLQDKIDKEVIDKNRINEYKKQLNEEFVAFKEQGMFSYMLFMAELANWCWDNNIPIGYGRGSVVGSLSAYILNITDVDSIKNNTIFSRFVNKRRISLADVDLDFAPSDRERVYDYIYNRFGKNNSSYIVTFNSIASKGVIGEITRALKYNFEDSMKIKKEFEEDEELTRKKYEQVFYYYDGLINTYVSVGLHPCGILASLDTLNDNIGYYYNKDGDPVSQCDMKSVDSLNYVKFDILGLKNIAIIKDAYKLIGVEYKKSYEIDWEDKDVWRDIISSPAGIFQMESPYAFSLLKKFKPQKIDDISLINASLRPSGESYRDEILERKFHYNPTKEIDELLKNNYGRLLYQEDSIRFLQEICGFSGEDADTVRRAIGKKDEKLLAEMLPKVKEGYINNSNNDRDVATKEVEEFLQVLSDSSDYQFGYNHSTAYSMIGYTCAYLRYHNPVEFTTAFFNNAQNEDDIRMGVELAKIKNIKINQIVFGVSESGYSFSDGEIYKGMESVKFINAKIPTELNQLSEESHFPTLLELIKTSTSVNSRQLDTLIKINYFEKYGNINRLLKYVEWIDKLKKKTYNKEKTSEEILDIIKDYADETPKMYRNLDKASIFNNIWESLNDIEDISIKEKMEYDIKYLGYIREIPDNIVIAKVSMVSSKYRSGSLTSLRNGESKWFKFKKDECVMPSKDDIIIIDNMYKKRGYKGREDIYCKSFTKINK